MMHRSPRSRRGRLATFAVSAVLITTSPLLLSGVASAAPAPVPVAAPLPPTTSLAANDVGLPSSLTLSAPGASQSLLLPVPDGLTLGSLTGVASVPVSSDAGALEFSSNNVVLGIVNLPASAPGVPSVPFSIPLSAATVVNGNATVTVTFRAAESQLTYFCGATQPVVVSLTSVGYTGTPRPSTSITTFLPPVLQTLDLYLPADPSPAIQQAAVDIELDAVSRYAPQPISVVVHTWDGSSSVPSVPAANFERSILVRSSPQAGSALETDGLGAPVLVFQGQGTALDNQTVVLAGNPNAAAQGTAANVQNVGPVPSLASQRQSFSQLGVSGSVTGIGALQLGLGIQEAKFGGAVSQYVVHLTSHYTPVDSTEKGTATFSIGSKVLSTNLLNSSGVLNTNLVIPSSLITQTTSLQVAVTYNTAGPCLGAGRLLSYSVDPQSYIDATLVSGGTGGFGALGAGLLPTFQVGLGSGSVFDELTNALKIAQSVQQATPVLLTGKITPLSSVLSSSQPALIVAPASQLPSSLDPPVTLKPLTTSVISGAGGATVTTNAPIATLQAFDQTSNNRTVLLAATAGSWSTFAPIQTQLASSGGWSALSGDTLLVGPSGKVSSLAIRAGGAQQLALSPETGNNLIKIGLLVSAIVIVLLLLAIAGLSRRRKRQRRSGAAS